jgi:transcriptional regulator with XRE-family HTH domain
VPQPPAIAKTIGDRVKERRTILKLSQTELAEKTDCHQADISDLERGKLHPRIDTIRKIATALGLPMAALLE